MFGFGISFGFRISSFGFCLDGPILLWRRYVMKRMLVLTASLVLAGSTAHAQYVPSGVPTYGGGSQSAMSYINLLQPNVNPAVTYMGIVQPQLQAQANF